MKIAILGTRGIPAKYGGFETFAEELSVRLAQKGIDVTVFCEEGSYDKSEYKGIKLKYVRAWKIGPLKTVLYDLTGIMKTVRGFDLMYIQGYGAGMFFCIPRLLKQTVWVNMDGLEWKRSKWPWYGKMFLRINEWCAVKWASLLIADARVIQDYLRSEYGSAINCHVIPYGAPIIEDMPPVSLIHEWGIEQKKYYVIVCRLEPENHVLEIINGYIASRSRYPLIIVGDHHANTVYTHKLQQLRNDSIHFVGVIYDKAKLQALRYHAFAYLHGHSVGGTNPSLLEALGCGNIVIAHENMFNREVLGDLGHYFKDAREISELIRKIENLPADKKEDLKRAARERITKFYNWDSIAEKYLELLKDTLNKA